MKKIKLAKENVALAFILILSGILNLFNLGIEGYANLYYASGVKSMTMSLKNFFFVSFDPAGFVSIDKPPVGFWLQAISAKIFGYHGWSIILPQAIAGILSVFVLYKLVKRSFGAPAGLLSGLFLAVTPVFVAVSRNNTIDNTLVFVLLLACYAMTIAAEKGKLKYLLLSMVLVGVGFNIKMLQAYMIGPALYLTYLLSTNISIKRRIINLAVSTVILVGVSLSWAVVVDRIPASSRPYVDSSTNNTVMELILGHNGAERLSLSSSSSQNGNSGGGPGGQNRGNFTPPGNGSFNPNSQNSNNNTVNGTSGATVNPNNTNSNTQQATQTIQSKAGTPTTKTNNNGITANQNSQAPNGNFRGRPFGGQGGRGPGMKGGFGNGGGGNSQNGLSGSFGADTKSGITRLFSKNTLSDQIVWFIPLAFLGFIAAAIREKLNFKLNTAKKQALVLWFMWLLPVFIYFSFNTGLFHDYYLTMLAPPVAALAAIGITSMWESYKEGGWKSWFLPIALLVNAAVQMLMLSYFYSTSSFIKVLGIILIVFSILPSIGLMILNLIKEKDELQESNTKRLTLIKIQKLLTALIVAGLVASPLTGSATVLTKAVSGGMPAAGLELLSNNSSGSGVNVNDGLVSYLEKHKTNEKYLLVVSSVNTAEGIIIKTGESVAALGGFLGTDKILTLNQFKEMVKKGEVRYVLVSGMDGGSGDGNEIMSWAAANGKLISSSEYSSNSSSQNNGFGGRDGNSGQLYDLKAYTDKNSKK